jgi:hypothetical protein
VPAGGDFQIVQVRDDYSQVQSPGTGVVVMLQHQIGVSAARRMQYSESFIANNLRDAPRYRVVAKALGSIGGLPAARVDGEFDNGTHFATRDYLVFPPNMVVLLMARGPVGLGGAVHSIADRVAASFVRG